MATRGNIYLKLEKGTKGQTLHFDVNKLPEYDHETQLLHPIKDVDVPEDALYMGVYHHWDSYISGLGKILVEKYKDYDTILNMMMMGDMSSLLGGADSYQGLRGDDHVEPKFITKDGLINAFAWDKVKKVFKPKAKKCLTPAGNLKPSLAVQEEFAYLFDGKKWKVAYLDWNASEEKFIPTKWMDLKKELKK